MTDQTRADFEAHFQLTTRQAWTHPDGSYKFPEIQSKWEGYQAGVAKAAPTSVLADCDIIAIANRHIEGWIANDKSVILECVTAAIREALRSAAAAPGADDAKDAARWRWLRETLSKAVGGGIEVNDQRLVYETPAPGEEVRVYWYPDTPVGFYESLGGTLDAAIDDAMKYD